MESTLTKIADAEKVYQKIKRIAFEIAEDNYDETEIVLAGICKATEGYVFAELLYKELSKISKIIVQEFLEPLLPLRQQGFLLVELLGILNSVHLHAFSLSHKHTHT